MSRARLIAAAAGVAGGLALAIVAAWFFLLRDTAEPVSVDNVITTFREGEQLLLQELADHWTVSLRAHAEHWAAVYPLTWRT